MNEKLESAIGWIHGPYRTAAANKQRREAQKAQRRQMQYMDLMNYEPQYATQRAQSPMARAYLESFLAGNNPDLIASTSPNAKYDKQIAQGNMDQMFGTSQDLLAQGKALREQPMPKIEIDTETLRHPDNVTNPEQAAAIKAGMPRAAFDTYEKSKPGAKAKDALAWWDSMDPRIKNDPQFSRSFYG